MNWVELIEKILYDFRLNPNSFSVKHNFPTFPNIFGALKRNGGKPSSATIHRIEEALNIKIDYSDPNNLSYKPAQNFVELKGQAKFNKNFLLTTGRFYKVVNSIDAGQPELIFREENYTGEEVFFPHSSDTCFALKVHGHSMSTNDADSINENDFVLCDLSASVFNSDIVAISLNGGAQMIKQYIEDTTNPEQIILRSLNPDKDRYPDIHVKTSDVLKIVKCIEQVRKRKL